MKRAILPIIGAIVLAAALKFGAPGYNTGSVVVAGLFGLGLGFVLNMIVFKKKTEKSEEDTP